MPKVSVVIPCYNQGKYINEAVESVLAQTFQDFEIIVVDDGSIDKSTKELLQDYSRFKTQVIFLNENKGVSVARNKGIELASGDYILPLDADDKVGEKYLEKAVEVLDGNSNVGIVYCLAKFFGEKKGIWKLPEFSIGEILLHNIIFCSAFFRKKDWEAVGGYDSNMSLCFEDWDFWLSLIGLGVEVFRLPEIMFSYRIKTGSRNSVVDAFTEDQNLDIRVKIFNNHKDLYLKNIRCLLKNIDVDNVKGSLSYRIGRCITKPLSALIR